MTPVTPTCEIHHRESAIKYWAQLDPE